jgi:ornithine cyclodeaminase/alanine dehydrogenase-like protein (mu-crystallin family)
MLYINRSTLNKIDCSVIQDAVQTAYQTVLDDTFNMPDRMHLADNDNMLLLMPCFSEDYFATKLVSVFPGARKMGQPVVNGMVVLCSNKTGQPLAIMDGAALTEQRTGAVGGLGVKLLTGKDIETGGVIGAGVQGLSQARYLLHNRDIERLYLYDLNPSMLDDAVQILGSQFKDLEIIKAASPKALVNESNVIIAATTAMDPVFQTNGDEIRGKTFISIGSFTPQMQEFPSEIAGGADHVFADTLFALKESGELAIPLADGVIDRKKVKPFASLLERNPYDPSQTILFKSVGMALFDLTVSVAIYELALEEDLGQHLDN